MSDYRSRVAAARRAFRENPDAVAERASSRFMKSAKALGRGVTEMWDRRYLGEPMMSRPRWLRWRGRVGDEGRLAAITAKFREAPWQKPEGWRGGLKRLGVKTERPPMWLRAPLLGSGRAADAARSVLREEYAGA